MTALLPVLAYAASVALGLLALAATVGTFAWAFTWMGRQR